MPAEDPDAIARAALAELKGTDRTAETPSAIRKKTAGEELAELADEVATALDIDYAAALLLAAGACPTLARAYDEERYAQAGEPGRTDAEIAGRTVDRLVQEHLRSRNLKSGHYAEALRAVCQEHPELARRWALHV